MLTLAENYEKDMIYEDVTIEKGTGGQWRM